MLYILSFNELFKLKCLVYLNKNVGPLLLYTLYIELKGNTKLFSHALNSFDY